MLTKTANVFYCLISHCVFVENVLIAKLDSLFYYLINKAGKKKGFIIVSVVYRSLSLCAA